MHNIGMLLNGFNNEVCYWQKVLKGAKSNRRRLNAPSFSDLFLPYRYIYISEPIFFQICHNWKK